MKKNLTILYRIITIIICITLVIGVLLKVLSLRRLTTDFQPIYTKETSTVISNPFCGFYQLAGYTPTDKNPPQMPSNGGKNICQNQVSL